MSTRSCFFAASILLSLSSVLDPSVKPGLSAQPQTTVRLGLVWKPAATGSQADTIRPVVERLLTAAKLTLTPGADTTHRLDVIVDSADALVGKYMGRGSCYSGATFISPLIKLLVPGTLADLARDALVPHGQQAVPELIAALDACLPAFSFDCRVERATCCVRAEVAETLTLITGQKFGENRAAWIMGGRSRTPSRRPLIRNAQEEMTACLFGGIYAA